MTGSNDIGDDGRSTRRASSPFGVTGLGHVLFALSFSGLGVMSLMSGDFALNWQPVPAWVPARTAFAYASGLMLCASGIGLFVDRIAMFSALVLVLNLLLWLVLLQLPRVLRNPTSEAMWLGFAETMMLVTAGWLLRTLLRQRGTAQRVKPATAARRTRVAQLLFAASLPVVGLSHFTSVQAASFVPAWLPYHLALARLTGAAHMAAGVALLICLVPRLAATLEAIMISLFTLLVWIPPIVTAPTARFRWTAFFASAALAGAAWVVANTLRAVSTGTADRAHGDYQ